MSKAEDLAAQEGTRGLEDENPEIESPLAESERVDTQAFGGVAASPGGDSWAPPRQPPAPMSGNAGPVSPGRGPGFVGGPAPRPPRATQPQGPTTKPREAPKQAPKNASGSVVASPVFWIVAAAAAVVGLALGTLLGVFVFGDRGEVSALEAEIEQREAEVADWKSKAAEFEEKNKTLSAELREKGEEFTALEEEAAQAAEDLAAIEAKAAHKEGEGAAGITASFGEGTYLVGSDIQPGTYRSSEGDHCYWTRLSGTGGTLDEIIANDIATGPTVVTIGPGDFAFDSYGCGTWTPAE